MKASVVVPVYNEEGNLPELAAPADGGPGAAGQSYEIVFVDDGCRDGSLAHPQGRRRGAARPDPRPRARPQRRPAHGDPRRVHGDDGEFVITLDADLQNPPEEIPKLVAKMDGGHDVVGAVRQNRQDSFFRRLASLLVNRTTVDHEDEDHRLRLHAARLLARRRRRSTVATRPRRSSRRSRRVRATPGRDPGRARRAAAGESTYSLYRLVRLNFDLMTGFSLVPLQVFGLLGTAVAFGGRVRRLPPRATPDRGRRGRGRLHALRHSLRVLGVVMAGPGPRRRVRRTDLPAGPRPAALPRPPRLRTRRRESRPATHGSRFTIHGSTHERVVVCAYSDVGYACLKYLLDRGEQVVLVYTHRDAPEEKALVSERGGARALARGSSPSSMENPLDPEAIARVRAADPTSSSRSTSGRSCPRRSSRCRRRGR